MDPDDATISELPDQPFMGSLRGTNVDLDGLALKDSLMILPPDRMLESWFPSSSSPLPHSQSAPPTNFMAANFLKAVFTKYEDSSASSYGHLRRARPPQIGAPPRPEAFPRPEGMPFLLLRHVPFGETASVEIVAQAPLMTSSDSSRQRIWRTYSHTDAVLLDVKTVTTLVIARSPTSDTELGGAKESGSEAQSRIAPANTELTCVATFIDLVSDPVEGERGEFPFLERTRSCAIAFTPTPTPPGPSSPTPSVLDFCPVSGRFLLALISEPKGPLPNYPCDLYQYV